MYWAIHRRSVYILWVILTWLPESPLSGPSHKALPELISIVRHKQNGRYLADDISKCNFLNKLCFKFHRSLQVCPQFQLGNKSLYLHIEAGCQTGDTHYPVYWRIYASSSGGRFKNAYELLNLRALKISIFYKNHIFQCMGKILCVEFQRVPLKFHTKYLTHTLKDVDFIHRWKFKSS